MIHRKTLTMAALLLAGPAHAQPAPAPAAPAAAASPYAVATESFQLGKAKGGLLATSFSAGDYAMSGTTNVNSGGGTFAISVMGSTKSKQVVTVNFSFTKADGTPVTEGRCAIASKT